MKQLLLLSLLFSNVLFCKAQEEVIFNDITVDKKEIKVAKTITGIEFNADLIHILPGTYTGHLFGTAETHLSYFHENRIANTWTLNKSVGLGNTFNHIQEHISNGSIYGSTLGKEVYQYSLSVDLKIEPRWYFDQRPRYAHNKSTLNNTGWFLSLPLTLSTNLLQQPVAGYNTQWLPSHFNMNIIAPPTIGYRNSLSKNLFWELSAGYIPVRAWFYDGSFILKSADKIGQFSADSFNSELKIAYTF